jgi:hypothetical protein
VLLVCARNKDHYGWFGTTEFRAAAFQDAYGAMLRVRVGPELPFVPVTREAREAMAAVSPAFAAVQAELAKGIARGWAGASESITQLPPEQEQIGGGWLVWAFREAAGQAVPHPSAHHTLASTGASPTRSTGPATTGGSRPVRTGTVSCRHGGRRKRRRSCRPRASLRTSSCASAGSAPARRPAPARRRNWCCSGT